MLSQDLVKKLFDYEEDGWLIWRKNGMVAGHWRHRYLAIRIAGVQYYAHRLIYLWHHGVLPEYVDHKDGDTINNRIENLRECTMSQNLANATYGVDRGVEKHGIKYRARIWVNGCRIELGSFDTKDEARAAFADAADRFFGEFAEINRNA